MRRDKHKNVDDYAFGGGAGMVMMIEPIAAAIEDLKSKCQYDEVIYMSPDGEMLDQKMANQYSLKKNLLDFMRTLQRRRRKNSGSILLPGKFPSEIMCLAVVSWLRLFFVMQSSACCPEC
jgi:hypothetical protein